MVDNLERCPGSPASEVGLPRTFGTSPEPSPELRITAPEPGAGAGLTARRPPGPARQTESLVAGHTVALWQAALSLAGPRGRGRTVSCAHGVSVTPGPAGVSAVISRRSRATARPR
eukprot:768606-Hanusia_phi.AAC.7